MGVTETDPLSQLSLPPGFRFFPTDEELLVQYLCRKVAGHHFSLPIIAEIDLYKFDPWVLPSKAIFGEKEWYFFSPRDRKYPNGSRPNRVAGTGYWKATGTDKVITTEGRRVGIKKALVFYVGKAPKGTKTNWIMHEYRLFEPSRKTGSSKLDDWVLCRIYKKNSGSNNAQNIKSMMGKEQQYSNNNSSSSSSSHLDDVLDSLPTIENQFFSLPRVSSLKSLAGEDKFAGLLNLGSGNFDWATLAGLAPVPELNPTHQQQQNIQQSNTHQSTATIGFGNADVYAPSVPAFCHVEAPGSHNYNNNNKRVLIEEEVQSGLRSNNNNINFFQQNSGGLTQSQGFATSADPYGFRYSGNPGGYGFGR